MTELVSAFEDERGAGRYLYALREHWLLILFMVATAVAVATVYSFTASKRYEATTDLLVMPVAGSDDIFVGIGLLRESDQSRSVITAARLIKTPEVAEAVRRRFGLESTRDKLLDSVETRPLEQSNILAIIGKSGTGQEAADIANAFASALIAQRTKDFQAELAAVITRLSDRVDAIPPQQRNSVEAVAIEQRLGELNSLVGANDPTLRVASRAVAPESPVWPRPALSIGVALLAALLLGTGVALALELINPRLKREDELLLTQRLPILTRVPRLRRRAVQKFLTGREPLPGDVREAYRTLRTSLATAGPDGRFPHTVLVTSAAQGEGKTMTCVNLATTLAVAGVRVILVEADLHRPMLGAFFGIPSRRSGPADLLVGQAAFQRALVPVPDYGEQLRLLPASAAHVIDLLEPRRVERLLAELKAEAEVIIIDSTPPTEAADALILADSVDAVLIAVDLGRTRRDRLNELRRMLAQRGVAATGFVVINRKRSRRRRYGDAPRQAPGLARAALPEVKAKAQGL